MRKRGIALMIVGVLFLLSSASLVFYNDYDDRRAGEVSVNILNKLESAITENNKSVSWADKYLPTDSDNKEMKTEVINSDKYIGIISVPSLNVVLPVMSSWDYSKLKLSPCRYDGSIYSDDLIIAAHNYEHHFGKIEMLGKGDSVIFTDVYGKSYNYLTERIEIIDGTNVKAMKSGDWDLTLFTCNYSGSKRITVRCIKE